MWLLLLITAMHFNVQAQNCTLNAGGPQDYCFDAPILPLNGGGTNVLPNSFQWVQISGTPVTITAPNDPVTSFGPIGSPTFTPGVYVFRLSGTCEAGGGNPSDDVTITISPGVTQAEIYDTLNNVINNDPYEVCNFAFMVGQTPNQAVGEIGTWSHNSTLNPIFIDSEDTIQAGFPANASFRCTEIPYFYTISNDGCESRDTVNVKHYLGESPVSINLNNPNICGDNIWITGTMVDCDATTSWQVSGVGGIPDPTFTTNTNSINVSFTQSGSYDVIYEVNTNGICIGGRDSVRINVCFSVAAGNTNEFINSCDDLLPLQIPLTAPFPATWQSSNTGIATVTQTGPNTAVANVIDQNGISVIFTATENNNACNFPDGSTIQCQSTHRVWVSRRPTFPEENDTLNIFCQDLGQTYNPQDILTTTTGLFWNVGLKTIDAPEDTCGMVIVDETYPSNTDFVFSCEGEYIFQVTSGTICEDTLLWVVNVATLQEPNAGSNAIDICLSDTVPLQGSLPIDQNNVVNLDASMTWAALATNPGPVTFVNGITDVQVASVTNFPLPGTYQFEYSFAREEGCFLTDTMEINVIDCPQDTCPCFSLMDCCTYWDMFTTNSKKYNNKVILSAIEGYRVQLKKKYGASAESRNSIDCDLCDYPTDEFPVFMVDTCTSPVTLISTGDYNISWSNNPAVNANPGYTTANQQVFVSVVNPDSSCTFEDSLLVTCCDGFDLGTTITPFCTACDPCENPNIPILIHAVGPNGPLTSTGYTFSWGGSFLGAGNGSSTQVYVNDTVWVEITDLATGCIALDTFTYQCCGTISAPVNLSCERTPTGAILSWDAVTSASNYQVFVAINDPDCCRGGSQLPFMLPVISTINTTTTIPAQYDCFSWYVTAACTTGDSIAQSAKACACPPVVTPCDSCNIEPTFNIDQLDTCRFLLDGMNNGTSCPSQQYQYKITNLSTGTTPIVLTGQSQVFNFSEDGLYEICLFIFVQDANGQTVCEKDFCTEIQIEGCSQQGCENPCEIDPIFDIVDITDGCTYHFDGINQGIICPSQQYEYTIYDAQGNLITTLMGEDQVYTFPQNGSYKVCLRIFVLDDDGNIKCEKTYCKEINVAECNPCDGECDLQPAFDTSLGRGNCEYIFTGRNDAGVNCPTQQYHWTVTDTNTGLAVNYTNLPTISFIAPPGFNTYKVCLTLVVYQPDGSIKCMEQACEEVSTRCEGRVIIDDTKKSENGVSEPSSKISASSKRSVSVTHAPNPANDEITIFVKGMAAISDGTHLIIYTNQGNTVLKKVVTSAKTNVDVSRLPAGLYHYYITSQLGDSEKQKLIIK